MIQKCVHQFSIGDLVEIYGGINQIKNVSHKNDKYQFVMDNILTGKQSVIKLKNNMMLCSPNVIRRTYRLIDMQNQYITAVDKLGNYNCDIMFPDYPKHFKYTVLNYFKDGYDIEIETWLIYSNEYIMTYKLLNEPY